jgi:hypothetical protein
MAILNTNPSPKDVVILQRDDTNTYYGETHISGSKLLLHINSSGHLDADTSASFYSIYPPPFGNAVSASFASQSLSTSFFITTNNPLPVDQRTVVDDIPSRDAIPLTDRYEGLTVWVTGSLQSYTLIGGLNNAYWYATPISASYAYYSSQALTASFALNGGGGGGGSANLLGSNAYVPTWWSNKLTTGSLIRGTNNNISINNPNPIATDTFTVSEVTNSLVLWTPTLMSTQPRLWYKADAITDVSASLLNLWPDSSPNKSHATASSAASRPTLTFNDLNGWPSVVFDGVSSQMRCLVPTSVSCSAVTAFVVAKVASYVNSTTPSNMGTLFGNSHGSNNRDIVVGNYFDDGTGGFTWDVYTENTTTNFSAGTPVTPFNAKTGEWYINTVVVNAASSFTNIYLSGSVSGSGNATLSTNLDLRDLCIGYESASNQAFNGNIAEIVIFTSSLSTSDQQYVEGYLAWKYGLRLQSGHPYSASMPTPTGNVGNIQVWNDYNNKTVAFMSSSGILYGTSSYAISASWAPGSSASSSWASQSLSSSNATSASYAFTASSAINAFQAVSASWAPVGTSFTSVSSSWASESFWSTSGSYASQSVWTISSSFASRSIFASTASWASQSMSSSNAFTSSYAVTASYATNVNPTSVSSSWASQSFSASYAVTASYATNTNPTSVSASFASQSISSSYAVTASYATNANPNAVSASWASQSLSSSTSVSASWARVSFWATSASFASQSISASWAPPVASDFSVSASWASQSFWATSASFASRSLFTTTASFASQSSVAVSSSFASQSISSSYATQASNSYWAISASWAPAAGQIGSDNYLPKWLGNSLTQTSLVYDTGIAVGVNATSSQIDAAFTVEAFNSGSSIIWTPQYLSTTSRLWLRADDVSGSTSASVSLWPDTGSYGNYFTQSNSTFQPFVITSSLNGHNVIHFDGVNDRLSSVSASTSIQQSSLSIFAVANPKTFPTSVAVNSTADIIANGHSGNSNDFQLGPRVLSSVREWSMYNETNSSNYDINTLASVSQSWYIANGEINANNSILTLYINGAATSSGVVNGSNLVDLRDLYVGYEPNFGLPFNGDIAEILISSKVLAPDEQRKVEGYLAWKYGLQNNLPPDHPYVNAAPLALNAGAIQSWKDVTSTTVAYVSSSGLFVGTSSWANNSISASWAPASGVTATAISSSWASQSLSASYASTASTVQFSTGTDGYHIRWVGTGSLSSTSSIYDNGTGIGFFTPTPTGSLTILNANNDYTNTDGAGSHIVLKNQAGSQNVISSYIGTGVSGKWRNDSSNNVIYSSYSNSTANGHWFVVNGDFGSGGNPKIKITVGGVRVGQNLSGESPTALLHLGGGDGTATRGQLKFDSSTLLGTPEAGAVEFNTDKWYCTINTGTSRKEFAICDLPLASGSLVGVTTNGRLINATGSGIIWGVSGSYAINSLSASVTGTLVNAPYFIPFVQNTGSQPLYISNNKTLQYNPAIDTLTLSNVTASLFGTASYVITSSYSFWADSASVAISASWAPGGGVALSASWASQSLSASWAPVPTSASFASRSIWNTTSSYASQSTFAYSASWASQSYSSSFSVSASWAPPVASNFSVSSSFASQSISSSWSSPQLVTGSFYPITSSDAIFAQSSLTADFALDSEFSWTASLAISASWSPVMPSASWASSSISSSYALTASWVSMQISSSWASQSLSASWVAGNIPYSSSTATTFNFTKIITGSTYFQTDGNLINILNIYNGNRWVTCSLG